MRELQLREKDREEKRKAQAEKTSQRPRKDAGQAAKKWKGKDWFAIYSPSMFGERVIGDTPTTNPKNLIGRNMNVGLSELQGRHGRDFYRIMLIIDRVDEKAAYTRFNGYNALREHVTRIIRKRTQKVDSVMYLETKDKWKLQVSSMAVLNRNTEMSVRKLMRAHIEKCLVEKARNSSIDELVRDVVSANLQRSIKKSGTKIYPIRFFEVTKIEVKGVPQKKAEPTEAAAK